MIHRFNATTMMPPRLTRDVITQKLSWKLSPEAADELIRGGGMAQSAGHVKLSLRPIHKPARGDARHLETLYRLRED